MKKTLFLLFFIILNAIANATTFEVGSTKTYTSPNALYIANLVQNGDTIEIDAETYIGQATLASWQSDDLLIRGVGGKPHLIANGEYILGKGIWVFAGDNITVENIEFSGATVPDQNGAGIRLDGIGMTVRYCYFHDNENGILTSNPYAGDILIEFSEFANNGYGDGFSHNLYIGHVNKLIFRFNYSHHTNIGHNLKSRANENFIYYNRIMDEETGNSSRLIDLSNGGFSIIMGNLLMQGENALNNNLMGYGKEGLSNTSSHELYIINNTMVNKRVASCIFVDIQSGTTLANISNNIFGGTGTMINGTTTTMTNNIVESNIENLHFVDEPNYDYHLNSTSPAIDMGTSISAVNGYALTPDTVYEHPTNAGLRSIVNNTIDVGAYEYGTPLGAHIYTTSLDITIYPNPFSDKIVLDGDFTDYEIKVYNSIGQEVADYSAVSSPLILDLNTLDVGLYFVSIQHTMLPQVSVYKIIKE